MAQKTGADSFSGALGTLRTAPWRFATSGQLPGASRTSPDSFLVLPGNCGSFLVEERLNRGLAWRKRLFKLCQRLSYLEPDGLDPAVFGLVSVASWRFAGTSGQLLRASPDSFLVLPRHLKPRTCLEKTGVQTWPKSVIFRAKWL